jgi:hypothetical protein
MDYIFDINIDARFGVCVFTALQSIIKIKLKLRVWKCEDGKFGMRAVWCPYVMETYTTLHYTREYGNNVNAQDETLNGGLHILKFCEDVEVTHDFDDEDVEVTAFDLSIAIDTHGFDGTPFTWLLLRERCVLNWHCMQDATMRVTRASEPDATTPVALPGQL